MKKIFNFRKNDELGKVIYVDSGQIIVEVTENNLLGKISIGNLVVIELNNKKADVEKIKIENTETILQNE